MIQLFLWTKKCSKINGFLSTTPYIGEILAYHCIGILINFKLWCWNIEKKNKFYQQKLIVTGSIQLFIYSIYLLFVINVVVRLFNNMLVIVTLKCTSIRLNSAFREEK